MAVGQVTELVTDDGAYFGPAEATVQQRVPQDQPASRTEPDGLCVGCSRLPVDFLHFCPGPGDPLDLRQLPHVCSGLRIVQGVRLRDQVDAQEGREQGQAGEGGGGQQPPPSPQQGREPHRDEQGQADEQELRAEAEEPAESGRQVALL